MKSALLSLKNLKPIFLGLQGRPSKNFQKDVFFRDSTAFFASGPALRHVTKHFGQMHIPSGTLLPEFARRENA